MVAGARSWASANLKAELLNLNLRISHKTQIMKKHSKMNISTRKIASHIQQKCPPVRLEALIRITADELAPAFVNSAPANEEEAGRLAREFRQSQPGIYKYLPYTDSTAPEEARENSLTCAFVRRLCLVLQRRFGWVPILKEADLQAAEVQAKELLAQPLVRAKVERIPAMKFAERGILGVRQVAGVMVDPSREKLLVRVLWLLICFSAAYATPHSTNSGQKAIRPLKA
jgi:hypothetical protein